MADAKDVDINSLGGIVLSTIMIKRRGRVAIIHWGTAASWEHFAVTKEKQLQLLDDALKQIWLLRNTPT